MAMRSTQVLTLAVSVLLPALSVTVNVPVALCQNNEPVAMAANRTTNAASRTHIETAPSNTALLMKLEEQQRQIDELRSMVQTLQSRLDSQSTMVASTRPVAATVRYSPPVALAVADPEPAPKPAPSPAPAPAPAAPTAATTAPAYRNPRELLPDIGHIGAEVGLLLGAGTSSFKNNTGFATGGFIDLPWKNVKGGKLSYEIMLGLQKSKTTQQTTSGVNVLVNAVLNSYLGNTAANQTSATNFLAGPLPITSSGQENAKMLTVAPVLLKYSVNTLGRFRPYVVGGLGMYVWIGSNNNTDAFNAKNALGNLASVPVGSSTLGDTLNAILRGSQIGGLVPTAPELAARGVPHGQGNLLFGGQIGGGFEYRISPKLSMGVDIRRNQLEGTNASFTTFAFKQGLHW